MQADHYIKYGFRYHPNFFTESELLSIEPILIKFHHNWLKENATAYSKGILNSHSLTASNDLSTAEKAVLFQFISKAKIVDLLNFNAPKFLNTQLFFDPQNAHQQNYWHRDIQYTGLTEQAQKEALLKQDVVHIRIPLRKELGIELIPETHRKWDTQEQYEVRHSLNGKQPSDPLNTGKLIELNRSDLLLFSANMLHRGIYGNNRFALDLIFFEHDPDLLKFRDQRNLPSKDEFPELVVCPIF